MRIYTFIVSFSSFFFFRSKSNRIGVDSINQRVERRRNSFYVLFISIRVNCTATFQRNVTEQMRPELSLGSFWIEIQWNVSWPPSTYLWLVCDLPILLGTGGLCTIINRLGYIFTLLDGDCILMKSWYLEILFFIQ